MLTQTDKRLLEQLDAIEQVALTHNRVAERLMEQAQRQVARVRRFKAFVLHARLAEVRDG